MRTFLLLGALACAVVPSLAHACDCGTGFRSLELGLERADAVVEAYVLDGPREIKHGAKTALQIELRVLRSWKGPAAESSIVIETSTSNCGIQHHFNRCEPIVVFAALDRDGSLTANQCSEATEIFSGQGAKAAIIALSSVSRSAPK